MVRKAGSDVFAKKWSSSNASPETDKMMKNRLSSEDGVASKNYKAEYPEGYSYLKARPKCNGKAPSRTKTFLIVDARNYVSMPRKEQKEQRFRKMAGSGWRFICEMRAQTT